MVITTKSLNESMASGIDISLKASKSGFTDKSTSELYKIDKNKTSYKSDDFKTVLNSKSNYKDQESNKEVDNVNENKDLSKNSQIVTKTDDKQDNDNVDELKEKLEDLEEKSKTDSKDNAGDILAELLAALAKLGIKEDLKTGEGLNSDMLKNILDSIKDGKSSNSDLSNVLKKILELLKDDSVKSKLNVDSLKSIEKVLSNISSNFIEDNSETAKNLKSGIKDLMSEISKMLNNGQDQNKKVLTLEDMLGKNYSQDSGEGSNDGNNGSTSSKDNKELSKDDKFLNSLIKDDKNDSENKINLFATRASLVQNQGANAVTRGLTINKATFVDDLIKDVKFMSNNTLKELTVKLNPGNLGEITIKLVQEDGLLKANLKANSKETTALLSQNLAEIKKQLSEQNIKVSDVNIDLYQDDTTFFKEQGFEGQFSGGQNNQNTNANYNLSNDTNVSSDVTEENLAEENSNVSFLA